MLSRLDAKIIELDEQIEAIDREIARLEGREDCDNPIRGEGGKFEGCAPGEGGGESTSSKGSAGKESSAKGSESKLGKSKSPEQLKAEGVPADKRPKTQNELWREEFRQVKAAGDKLPGKGPRIMPPTIIEEGDPDHDPDFHLRVGDRPELVEAARKEALQFKQRAAWRGASATHVDTQAAYVVGKAPNGLDKYAPERESIHNEYTKKVTAGVPKSESPTVYMTGGGPASGKTTGLLENPKTGIPDKSRAAHIDPDGAKEFIPEYKAGKAAKDKTAAAFVHEESSHMSKASTADALKNGHDVVFDSVGDSGIDKLSKKVADMRRDGAKRVVAQYATVDVDEALRRSDARAERTGRFVPHEYIRAAHKDVSITARAAIDRGLFDAADIWDTTGREPKHIATYTKETGLEIKDQAGWDAFVKRGE